MRLLIEIVDATRAVPPEGLPLFVRLSASDWTEGGLTIDDTVAVARVLKQHGVDLYTVGSNEVEPYSLPPIVFRSDHLQWYNKNKTKQIETLLLKN